ncbi:MAG: helix-hairpin-helix domain-containing protein [Candidatus Brocadiales bacterium]|nr:helix-hairpin-helix domain-containing protein [Candidatus Brocadiales bacterium]
MSELPGPLKIFEFSRKESLAAFFLITTLLIGTGIKYATDQHWWLPETEVVDTDPESIKLKIDLNRAEWYELIILPGIGEQKARTIVEYRKETGAFKNIEQLREVNGIGIETVKRIKDLVFVDEEKRYSRRGAKAQGKSND